MKLTKTLGVACATALVAGLAVATDAKTDAKTEVKGTVTGTVKFEGELPKIKPLTISAETAKGCCADGEKVDDTDTSLLVDAKSKGIANVVIALTVEGQKAKIREEGYEVDQVKCRFLPRITVVPAGATVSFKNSDTVSHNIHTYPVKNEGINRTVASGKDTKQVLKAAEPVKVGCDIHPWMGGYVYVTSGTHWTTTGADGSFSLADVPAGEYKLEIWHEKLGKGKGTATVNPDGSCAAVEITMSMKKKGRGRGRGR